MGKTIAELSWTSNSVTISGISARERSPCPSVCMNPRRGALDGGAKCSCTNCQTNNPAITSIPPATKNVPRMPATCAITPPITGPAEMPT